MRSKNHRKSLGVGALAPLGTCGSRPRAAGHATPGVEATTTPDADSQGLRARTLRPLVESSSDREVSATLRDPQAAVRFGRIA